MVKEECLYNKIKNNKSKLNDCDKCLKDFYFPYDWCCLEECNEHEACKDCDMGINLL